MVLNEKVSNFDGLLDKYMGKMEQKIYKIWPKGRIGFSIPLPPGYAQGYGRQRLKIDIDIGPKGKKASRMRKREDHYFIIHINTQKEQFLDSALGVIAHEVTHVSQYYNKSMKFHEEEKFKAWMSEKESGKYFGSYQDYYQRNHDKYPTEHEAVLVNLGYGIGKGNYDDAMITLFNAPNYLQHFDKKTLLKKLAYMGIDNKKWQRYKKHIATWTKDAFSKEQLAASPANFIQRFNWFVHFNGMLRQIGMKTDHHKKTFKRIFYDEYEPALNFPAVARDKDFPPNWKNKADWTRVGKIISKW